MEAKLFNFIEFIKKEFDLSEKEIGCEYVEDLEYYRIWHTKQELEINKSFRKKISLIIRKYFLKQEIRDIVFTYDYEKDMELRESFSTTENDTFSIIDNSTSIRNIYLSNFDLNSKQEFTNIVSSFSGIFDDFNKHLEKSKKSSIDAISEDYNYTSAA